MSGSSQAPAGFVTAAQYQWPDDDVLGVEVLGVGRPLIAVGLLPHANEPLGSAFASALAGQPINSVNIALVGPIDPPPPAHRFPLPTDVVTYAARGYLQPLPDQVEFAHCPNPATPAQHRAAVFRARLRELQPDALMVLHNDVGARAPYLYANRSWPEVEHHLRTDVSDAYSEWSPPRAAWTHHIGQRTYAFFPCERIGVHGSYSAGCFIEHDLGVPTLTLELPIFDWGDAERARAAVVHALAAWIGRGGTASKTTDQLVREVKIAIGARDILMLSAEVTARTVWAALHGLVAELATAPARRDCPTLAGPPVLF